MECPYDNWFGVTDPRKRKQIQDRLAQRAHRRRKRLVGLNSISEKHAATQSPGCDLYPCSNSSASNDTRPCTGQEVHFQYHTPVTTPSSGSETQEAPIIRSPCVATTISLDHWLLPLQITTVYGALYNNGRILGIPCTCTGVSKSRPAPSYVPGTLQPIPLQLSAVHFEFIDRFPFPRLRYNMIALSDVFNAEEFMADLFIMPSFTIQHGSMSWDPEAWTIGEEFKAKWGFLF